MMEGMEYIYMMEDGQYLLPHIIPTMDDRQVSDALKLFAVPNCHWKIRPNAKCTVKLNVFFTERQFLAFLISMGASGLYWSHAYTNTMKKKSMSVTLAYLTPEDMEREVKKMVKAMEEEKAEYSIVK